MIKMMAIIMSANHLKYICGVLYLHLSGSFFSILVHSAVPAELLLGTTIPIPEGLHANLSSAKNFVVPHVAEFLAACLT
jgi:hypothetical protein